MELIAAFTNGTLHCNVPALFTSFAQAFVRVPLLYFIACVHSPSARKRPLSHHEISNDLMEDDTGAR